jgi:hypothetical protein
MQTDRSSSLARRLLIAGAALAALGVLLIPLPGPGLLVLALAVPVLAVGAVLSVLARRAR